MSDKDLEIIARQVNALGVRITELEVRVLHSEQLGTNLEEAALLTARTLEEISLHWDRVYAAIRRET